MIHIDLSFLKIANQTEKEKHKTQTQVNDNFKYKIFDLYTNSIAENSCSDCVLNLEQFNSWDNRNIVEVESEGFWGIHFCEITQSFERPIRVGDLVLETDGSATDISIVKDVGKLVNLKRNRMRLSNEPLPRVTRLLTKKDAERYQQNIEDEKNAEPIFKELAEKFKLQMKLVNIHYQFDRKKLYFFYTADGRVDFRELAKELANRFRTRIELRQIGVRDEAQKIGGIGTCGREYCCSTFLKSFKRIQTQMVIDQNLSTSASKLSGPCGKLKCCLSFELPNKN